MTWLRIVRTQLQLPQGGTIMLYHLRFSATKWKQKTCTDRKFSRPRIHQANLQLWLLTPMLTRKRPWQASLCWTSTSRRWRDTKREPRVVNNSRQSWAATITWSVGSKATWNLTGIGQRALPVELLLTPTFLSSMRQKDINSSSSSRLLSPRTFLKLMLKYQSPSTPLNPSKSFPDKSKERTTPVSMPEKWLKSWHCSEIKTQIACLLPRTTSNRSAMNLTQYRRQLRTR